MRSLVIGGNRFFGKRLVQTLVNKGDEVTVLNRGSVDDGLGSKIERIKFDRRDSASLEKAVSGRTWDVVFDQVCFDAFEAREASRIFNGHVGRYIVTSSQSVYHSGRDLNESAFDPNSYSFAKENPTKENYAEAKRQMEAVFYKEAKFPLVAVRFPIVLGTDDYTERLLFHIRKALREEPVFFPNLQARLPFIDSSDAADALLALGTLKYAGPINLCSPQPIYLAKLIQMIEVETGHEMQLVASPNSGEWSPYGIKEDWFMNTDLAQSLGIKARPLEMWLPQLIQALTAKARVERGV